MYLLTIVICMLSRDDFDFYVMQIEKNENEYLCVLFLLILIMFKTYIYVAALQGDFCIKLLPHLRLLHSNLLSSSSPIVCLFVYCTIVSQLRHLLHRHYHHQPQHHRKMDASMHHWPLYVAPDHNVTFYSTNPPPYHPTWVPNF